MVRFLWFDFSSSFAYLHKIIFKDKLTNGNSYIYLKESLIQQRWYTYYCFGNKMNIKMC